MLFFCNSWGLLMRPRSEEYKSSNEVLAVSLTQTDIFLSSHFVEEPSAMYLCLLWPHGRTSLHHQTSYNEAYTGRVQVWDMWQSLQGLGIFSIHLFLNTTFCYLPVLASNTFFTHVQDWRVVVSPFPQTHHHDNAFGDAPCLQTCKLLTSLGYHLLDLIKLDCWHE